MNEALQSTYYFDFEDPIFQEKLTEIKSKSSNKREQAVLVYNFVRDQWRYNPYKISMEKEKYLASHLFKLKEGHCIDKSILMISLLRALNIPSKLHLAKVKNHIAVEKLIATFGTNELAPHGYVDLEVDGSWLKASPAFNASLCKKFNVEVLEFDGYKDSIFQEFNKEGQEFMEYLEDYGSFNDLPLAFIKDIWAKLYPDFQSFI